MQLNYRHSLKTMNKELAKHNICFSCIRESSNKTGGITYILKEKNSDTGDMTQTCGYYYTTSDAVAFINKLT